MILPPFPECEFLAGRMRLHGHAADAVEHHLLDLLPTRPSSFDGDTAELVGVRLSEATKVLTTAQMLESPITAWKNLFVKAIHIITRPAPVAKTITLAMNQKRLGCIFLLSRRTNIATLNGLTTYSSNINMPTKIALTPKSNNGIRSRRLFRFQIYETKTAIQT